MNAILEGINSVGRAFVEFAGPMLVQSSVLIAILLAGDFLLRRKVRAVLRYWLWMLVLVKMVLPISLTTPVSLGQWFGEQLEYVQAEHTPSVVSEIAKPPAVEMVQEPRQLEGGTTEVSVERLEPLPVREFEPAETAEATEATEAAVAITPVTWQGWVFLGWLAGVVVMGLLLVQRAIFVLGLVAQAKGVNGLMGDTLKYCCGRMGVKGEIGLKVSANATSPAVCGLFRPVILVPQDLGPNLGAAGLRVVLMHELAHIRRGDLWVNLVQTVLQIVYFYNPLLWVANAVIRRVREQAVDEAVQVAMGERAGEYPETLVRVAKLAFERPALSLRLIGVVESKSTLEGRVRRMLERPLPKSAKLGFLGLAMILVIGSILLPMAKGMSGPPELVIKGRVTAAETGQPIAGAKVGDVEKYAEGQQWTTTDSDGNYSYLTWYEEHGIKAEADGFKRQNKGFGTKLFGSEKEKVLDFQLTPEKATEQSEFTAILSNGVTVELVGVCEHPSEGKRWWRPDGSLLEEAPYDDDPGRAFPQDGEKGYKFAVKYRGLAGKDVDARIIPTDFKTTNGGALFSTSKKNGKENAKYVEGLLDEKIVWLGAAFDEKLNHCDIRIGVCWGDWKSEYRYETDQPDDAVEWVEFKNVSLKPNFKTADQIETESEKRLFWGQEVNGLRASVGFILEKECYNFGEEIGIQFSVQNISNRIIKLATTAWRFGGESKCVIKDKDGKSISVTQTYFTGWSKVDRHEISPGQTVVLKSASLAIAKNQAQAEKFNHPIAYSAVLEPGEYSLHYELKFPDIIRRDANGNVTVPLPDDWEGTLITGKRKLCINSTDESERKPAVGVEGGDESQEMAVFESYFPDDAESGRKLTNWWENKDSTYLDDDSFFDLFLKGLRTCTIEYKGNFPMQHIGGEYIQRKEPDEPRAVEIVYHASFSPEFKYYAVYSGLSVANPKSEKVLRRLVDIAMEPHQLGRIIWGVKQSGQEDEFMALLEPYLQSSDLEKSQRADVVAKSLRGEIDAGKWEREWNQQQKTDVQVEGEVVEGVEGVIQASELAAVPVSAEKSLQELIDAAGAGETVIVPEGVYTEPVRINKSLKLKGQSLRGSVFEVTANEPAIFVDAKGKDEVTIEGLTIKWQLATSDKNIEHPFAVAVKDTKAEIKSCNFVPLGNPERSPVAIRAMGFSNLNIEACRFEGFEYVVCYGEGTEGAMSDSLIMDCGHQGVILYSGATAKIIGNVITGSKYHAVRSTGGTLEVKDNLIIENANRGIYLGNKSAGGVISNNIIMGNGTGISGFAQSKVRIQNNIIADSSYAGISMQDSCSLSIRNNILQGNAKGCILQKEGSKDANKVFRNLFWQNEADVENFDKPAVSISAEPGFVDPDNGDFSLKAGAALEHKQGLTDPNVFKILWKRWKNRNDKNEPFNMQSSKTDSDVETKEP